MKTSREYAVVCTGDCDDIQRSAAVSSAVIRLSQVDYLSKEIAGGVFGMDYSETKTDGNYIDLNVSYRLKNPITFFGNKYIRVSGRGCSRKWIGFDPNEDESQDRYVYVTEYGTVYHKSLSCKHLDLSIHAVDKSGISKRRNEGGGRYKSCPLCKGKNASGLVYITDYGDVYHSRLSCSGLKRTIKCLKLSDAKEKYKACSKCAS